MSAGDALSRPRSAEDEVERLAELALAVELESGASIAELEQIRHELDRLLNELEFYSPNVRDEFRAEPPRAVRVCREAIAKASALTSPAGYAIAKFRAGYDPAAPRPHELPPEPLELEELVAGLEWARAHDAPAQAIAALEQELELARSRVAP